jgi:hypothetical protein
MKYFKVLHCGEYSKKNGLFGIVDSSVDYFNDIFDGGKQFPEQEFSNLTLTFEGNDKKNFADFQMCYFPWRLISQKMYLILEKYLESGFAKAYPKLVERQGHSPELYYFLHFFRKLEVIDEIKTVDPGQFPIVNGNLLVGVDIFSYNVFTPSVFGISERVKVELEMANITGCSYQLISD